MDQELSQEQSATAENFLTEGEFHLLKGRFSEAIKAFEAAATLDPTRPDLHFRQGLSLFEYGSEEGREKLLLAANKKFKDATLCDPHYIDAFHVWGNSLTLLGETREENHYFIEAKAKYEKALSLVGNEPTETHSDLYWDYGVAWYHIGNYSEEPVDYQLAIQAFEKAKLLSSALPADFWIDYGTTSLLLAQKVSDVRLTVKAIHCLKHAVSQDDQSYDGWISLAESLQELHQSTHDEDHFAQAIECYDTASKLDPQDGEMWLQWAEFMLETARRNSDVKRLRGALEKCHHAYACNPEDPMVLGVWAESLALLGELTERLDLLHEAQNKMEEAFEISDGIPELWLCFGNCLCSFGEYFEDFDHFYQAIEKFQTGLSLDRTYSPLWHAIAKTYVKVGMLESDIEPIIQSLKFFEKALQQDRSTYLTVDYAMALAKLGEHALSQDFLEHAVAYFEKALAIQRNAVYLHPDWLYHYAETLDLLGDFHDEESYYTRAIEIFSHVLMVDPDFPHVHHRLAQTLCHLGELAGEVDYFYRAIHHLRLALKHEDENDHMILDWGIALINIAQRAPLLADCSQLYEEAKHKMTLSAKLGNVQAYYHLGCLYSLLEQPEKSLHFLIKADEFKSLPPIEEMVGDEWLENVRATGQFQIFLSHLESRPNMHEER